MMIVYNKTFTRRLYMGPIFGPYFPFFGPIFEPYFENTVQFLDPIFRKGSNFWTIFFVCGAEGRVFNMISTEFSTGYNPIFSRISSSLNSSS